MARRELDRAGAAEQEVEDERRGDGPPESEERRLPSRDKDDAAHGEDGEEHDEHPPARDAAEGDVQLPCGRPGRGEGGAFGHLDGEALGEAEVGEQHRDQEQADEGDRASPPAVASRARARARPPPSARRMKTPYVCVAAARAAAIAATTDARVVRCSSAR